LRRPRLLPLFPLFLALAGTLAACGGGGDTPSDEDYFRKMVELYTEFDERFQSVGCDETATAKQCATGFAEAASFAMTQYESVTPAEVATNEHQELIAALTDFREEMDNAEGDFEEADTAEIFYEGGSFDVTRINDALCAIQDLANEKSIKADVGCSEESVDPSTLPPQETTEVLIQDFAFDPPVIQIAAGETVTWTQGTDGETHTITADDETFDSGNLTKEGATFEFTLDEPSDYPYYCRRHPQMIGLITVVE
jgi:plastocyanin